MPTKSRKKRPASKPAWELSSNREMAKALDLIESRDYSSFVEMEFLLLKHIKSPSSLSYQQEDTLDRLLLQMSYAPADYPDKQKVIELCSGTKNGQSIANYLQDPSKVGVLR